MNPLDLSNRPGHGTKQPVEQYLECVAQVIPYTRYSTSPFSEPPIERLF